MIPEDSADPLSSSDVSTCASRNKHPKATIEATDQLDTLHQANARWRFLFEAINRIRGAAERNKMLQQRAQIAGDL